METDGAPARAHLELAAKRGSAAALAALEGPECPEALEYLLGWAYTLHGRSGISEVGVAPLSYAEVDAWARRTRTDIEPWEVEALMAIDAALRHPGEDEPEEEEERPVPVWPTRKAE